SHCALRLDHVAIRLLARSLGSGQSVSSWTAKAKTSDHVTKRCMSVWPNEAKCPLWVVRSHSRTSQSRPRSIGISGCKYGAVIHPIASRTKGKYGLKKYS